MSIFADTAANAHGQADAGREYVTLYYRRGIAVRPLVVRSGSLFVASIDILDEDGEATGLGELGYFANRLSALAFAVRCGNAFADDQPLPKPPCGIASCAQAPKAASRRLCDTES